MHMYILIYMVDIQRPSAFRDVMDVVGSEDEYRELGPQRSLGCPGGCFAWRMGIEWVSTGIFILGILYWECGPIWWESGGLTINNRDFMEFDGDEMGYKTNIMIRDCVKMVGKPRDAQRIIIFMWTCGYSCGIIVRHAQCPVLHWLVDWLTDGSPPRKNQQVHDCKLYTKQAPLFFLNEQF